MATVLTVSKAFPGKTMARQADWLTKKDE